MSSHGVGHTVGHDGVLRRLVIVAVLTVVLVELPEFRLVTEGAEIDPSGMVALGGVILAAYAIGELVEVIGLPHITGYLLAGLLYGPSFAHVLPEHWQIGALEHGILSDNSDQEQGPLGIIQQLGLLDTLAVALIALTAGGELKLDELKRGGRYIAGMLVGQTVTILAGIVAFMLVIGGWFEGFGIPSLSSFGTKGTVAFGLLVGAISLATSPASTIAVINGSRANGPMSRLVLSAVVLKDVVVVVLFALFGALAGSLLGVSTSDVPLWRYIAEHIGGSIVIGTAVGGILIAYLRWVNVEVLLFLIGLIYATSFAAGHTLDPVLLFITSGFVAGMSKQGDELIHHVERLSLPVYVVFFTLTGARMHLDSLAAMAPYAMGLVGVRLLMLFIGVRSGAQLTGSPATVTRFGWLGYASQAGVAITLATVVGKTFSGPEFNGVGQDLQTLIIAAIAVNEFIGPVLLKFGLQLAGELPSSGAAGATEAPSHGTPAPAPEHQAAPDDLPRWEPPAGRPVHWGDPPDLESVDINRELISLQEELVGLVRDVRQGPVEDWRTGAQDYLRTLRREFLRHHRRSLVRTQKHAEDADASLETCMGEGSATQLAERWRSVVLDRSAMIGRPDPGPLELVQAVDRLVLGLPGVLRVPVEPSSFLAPADESPVKAVARVWLRLRRSFYGLTGGGSLTREVDLRRLAEYHLSGSLAGRLEPYAALLVLAEDHLASRTRAIFDNLLDSYEELNRKWCTVGAVDDRVDWLHALRSELEEDFQLAAGEVDRVAEEAALRVAHALSSTYVELQDSAARAGTVDLPDRAYQYSKVYPQRTADERMLTDGLTSARRNAAAGYASLALELELMGLEGRIQSAVGDHGDQLARMVRGRGPKQLDRVDASLRDVLSSLETHLAVAETGDQLGGWIRSDAEPLERVVSEAHRAAVQLRVHLTAETTMAPLLDELLKAAQSLTDRYRVPASRRLRGDHALPPAVETVDIPFSELVITYVESGVTRELMEVTRALADDVDQLVGVLEELERVVAFNVELAGAELDVFDQEPVPEATRELVREIVSGALTRTRSRLQTLREEASLWEARARDGLQKAVVAELDELRAKIADGRVGELRRYLTREAANRRLQRGSGVVWATAARLWRQTVDFVRLTLGPERMMKLREALGLPLPPTERTKHYSAPEPAVTLPVVYRRLFSDQALEAGDLLTGRQVELDQARAVLDGPGIHKAVALVGLDGVGKGAVINALVRGLDQRRVRRIALRSPAVVTDVDRWFDEGLMGTTVVLTGLQWLFTMQPHGFDPLRRLIDRMITDRTDVRWILGAEVHVWQSAAEVVPLEDAFPEVIHLEPLDTPALEAALLARHTMSGYQLEFHPHRDLHYWWRAAWMRNASVGERNQSQWFTALQEATGGVVQDALRLWMASIVEVDEEAGSVVIGPVPAPPLRALRQLPDEHLLSLRQVARQGWMTPGLHATLFRTDVPSARAHLNRLAHLGVLENRGDERYEFHPAFTGPLHRILQERGWLR